MTTMKKSRLPIYTFLAVFFSIAIPISIFHNYFVSRIDSLVIDMEESAQKMIDTLHAIERGRQAAAS